MPALPRFHNGLVALFLISLPGVTSTLADPRIAAVNAHLNAAAEAEEAGAFEQMVSETHAANAIRPNHPLIVRQLVTAHLKADETSEAMDWLRALISIDANLDLTDEAFSRLQSHAGWNHLVALRDAYSKPVARSELAFRLHTPEMHPEGIAWDPVEHAFYISSIRTNQIVRYFPEMDRAEVFYRSEEPRSFMGLAVDAERRILWACENLLPQHPQADASKVQPALLRINLERPRDIRTFPIDGAGVVGDLVVHQSGSVFMTDSANPVIYQWTEADGVAPFLRLESAWNLQGLALSDDASTLFVADYIQGCYRIQIADQSIEQLQAPPFFPFKGTDGLAFHDGALIAIQNGLKPMRIVRYQLNAAGSRIAYANTLERATFPSGEPTLGLVVDGDFHYITNSPWNAYDDAGEWHAEVAQDPEVRRIDLSMTMPTGLDSADARALFATDLSFAALSRDLGAAAAFRQFLAPEALLLPAGGNPVEGRNAIYQQMQSFLASLDWQPQTAQVAASSDMGWTWGFYQLTVPTEEGEAKVHHGKYANVWTYTVDGWKVLLDVGNASPAPQ